MKFLFVLLYAYVYGYECICILFFCCFCSLLLASFMIYEMSFLNHKLLAEVLRFELFHTALMCSAFRISADKKYSVTS